MRPSGWGPVLLRVLTAQLREDPRGAEATWATFPTQLHTWPRACPPAEATSMCGINEWLEEWINADMVLIQNSRCFQMKNWKRKAFTLKTKCISYHFLSTKLKIRHPLQSLNNPYLLSMYLAPDNFPNTLIFILLEFHNSLLTQVEPNKPHLRNKGGRGPVGAQGGTNGRDD